MIWLSNIVKAADIASRNLLVEAVVWEEEQVVEEQPAGQDEPGLIQKQTEQKNVLPVDSSVLKHLEQKAWEAGYEQAFLESKQQREREIKRIKELAKQLERLGQSLLEQQATLREEQQKFVVEKLVPLAFEIAERFLDINRADVYEEMLATAIQTLSEWQPSKVRISVSPDDLEWWHSKTRYIAEQLPDVTELNIVPDEQFGVGDWLFDTDVGGLVSKREEQMSQIERELSGFVESGVRS